MSKSAVNDLMDQYRRSFVMFYEEVERFNQAQWVKGIDNFLVPVKVAMHTLDCLDYYFSGKSGDEYPWGYRFGNGWWDLADDQLPGKGVILEYAREIEMRVSEELNTLEDAQLARPFTTDDAAMTLLGHYVYALRHTLHHQGELAVLSVYHGNAGGSWA